MLGHFGSKIKNIEKITNYKYMIFRIFKPFVHLVNIGVPVDIVGASIFFESQTVNCLWKHSEGRGAGGARLQDWWGMLADNSRPWGSGSR